MLEFSGDEKRVLAALYGQPGAEQLEWLLRLVTLGQVVKFRALAPITFNALGVPPLFLHGVVGTSMWKQCWGERAASVGGDDVPPYQLLKVAFEVALTLEKALIDQATEQHRLAANNTLDVARCEENARAKRPRT